MSDELAKLLEETPADLQVLLPDMPLEQVQALMTAEVAGQNREAMVEMLRAYLDAQVQESQADGEGAPANSKKAGKKAGKKQPPAADEAAASESADASADPDKEPEHLAPAYNGVMDVRQARERLAKFGAGGLSHGKGD